MCVVCVRWVDRFTWICIILRRVITVEKVTKRPGYGSGDVGMRLGWSEKEKEGECRRGKRGKGWKGEVNTGFVVCVVVESTIIVA